MGQWDPPILKYVQECKDKGYSARYIGSMVADVHRTLLYGGIFLYPANKDSPSGKLRLLYEGNPMAFIVKAAGGRAIVNGEQEVLTYKPTGIHCRTQIIIGSWDDVTEIETMYRQYSAKQQDQKPAVDSIQDLIDFIDS